MKSVITLVLFLCFFSVSGQESTVAGNYKGEISSDSVSISVSFDINQDSTYKITVAYEFTEYCPGKGKDIWVFEGTWNTENNWLFLYPANKGITLFYQYEDRSKKEEKIITRNMREGAVALEITQEKDNCPRIYFQLNTTCLKDIWNYYYIEKLNCPDVKK